MIAEFFRRLRPRRFTPLEEQLLRQVNDNAAALERMACRYAEALEQHAAALAASHAQMAELAAAALHPEAPPMHEDWTRPPRALPLPVAKVIEKLTDGDPELREQLEGFAREELADDESNMADVIKRIQRGHNTARLAYS